MEAALAFADELSADDDLSRRNDSGAIFPASRLSELRRTDRDDDDTGGYVVRIGHEATPKEESR